MQKVLDGQLPVNHAILGNLQDVFNLLPNLSTAEGDSKAGTGELAHAMSIKTNDQLMTIYLSSLIRAITAFHDLIENKIQNRQQAEDKKEESEKEEVKDASKDATPDAKDGDKEKETKDKTK